jgi:SAM-dependent methyltransferase
VEADLDQARLPFADASVQTCVMLDVLPYLESPRAFVEEVRRVVQTGGRFLVSVPNARQASRLIGLARGRPISLSRLEALYGPGQRHLFSDRSLRDLLEASGFHCESLLGLLPATPSLSRRIASKAARGGWGRAWLAPGVLAVGRRR